jgi:adenylate cyclase
MGNGTQNPIAFAHYQTGRELFKTYTRQGAAAAKNEFSEAIALDTGFARAYGWLAYVHLEEVQQGWSIDVDKSWVAALDLAAKGVELAPLDYYPHWNYATVLLGHGDFEDAEAEFDKALGLSSDPDLLADVADKLSYRGDPEAAIKMIDRAIKQKIPQWFYWSKGFAHFLNEEFDKAVDALEEMVDPPNTAYLLLMACKKARGDDDVPSDEAILERLLNRDPEWTPAHLGSFPFEQPQHKTAYKNALGAIGIQVPS